MIGFGSTAKTTYIEFEKSGRVFRVMKNPFFPDDGDMAFVGYCGDLKSVSANQADTCARALVRKHLTGLPRGEVVRLADHVRKKFDEAGVKGGVET